jgi:hypothetical protein
MPVFRQILVTEVDVIAAKLSLVVCSALFGQPPGGEGAIGGRVVIAPGQVPAGGAEVVLRVNLDGQFVPLAETTADTQGRFLFEPLPIGNEYLYLPGANREGVHYPGARIRLTSERPRVDVQLQVCDAVTAPNPLVAQRHEIVIRPERGALNVTETIVVENPTSKCYVGRAAQEGAEPVTLQLAIPPDFQRATFHREFFGRSFSLAGGKLVTTIPWQPGERELKFTYVVPTADRQGFWERQLDLPCSQVRVCVRTDKPEEVSCSLNAKPVKRDGEVIFESQGRTLPAGYAIRAELGRVPLSFMTYGRWGAVATLGGLITWAGLLTFRRGRCPRGPTAPGAASPPRRGRPNPTSRRRSRASRPNRTRNTSSR